MDEEVIKDNEKDNESSDDVQGQNILHEARYSLKEMMQEVAVERKQSAFARELVDTTEIKKIFKERRRAIRKR